MTIPVVPGSLACFVHVHVILEFICDSVSVCAQLIKVFCYFPKKYIAKLMLQLGKGWEGANTNSLRYSGTACPLVI